VLNGNQEAYDTGLLLTQMGTGVVMDMALSSPCVCFVAGTQVSTQRGFEVEDFRTYYVGESSVLVHNTCDGDSSQRGVGGKGWVGDKTWRENVSTVGNGGTITSLNGGVPTEAQAMQLINQSGGTFLRMEKEHPFPNPHNYTHINYVTGSGVKGTIKIYE